MKVPSVSARKEVKISQEIRDQIVLEHLPLVKAIAIRVHENLPVHVDLDDLIHAGVLGLFDAVAKFDRRKKVEFHSYAKHRIKGAILDSLRQLDWRRGICGSGRSRLTRSPASSRSSWAAIPMKAKWPRSWASARTACAAFKWNCGISDRSRYAAGTTWTGSARRSFPRLPSSSRPYGASGGNWKAPLAEPSERFRRATRRLCSCITPTR